MDSINLAKDRDKWSVVYSHSYDLWSHFSFSFHFCDLHKPCLGLLVVRVL
jgi:hypothetical protein